MKEVIDKTFESMFAFEDVRQIWRDTVPSHKLSENQKDELSRLLNLIRENIDFILEKVNTHES